MTDKVNAIIHKPIFSYIFISITALYLSFSGIFNIVVCSVDCTCGCTIIAEPEEIKETEETDDCCTVQVVVVSDCCSSGNNPHRKTLHFSVMFDRDAFNKNIFALQSNIFSSYDFTELSFNSKEESNIPISIVYYIFRPPKVDV